MSPDSDPLGSLKVEELLDCLPPPVAQRVALLDSQGVAWDQIGNLLALTPSAALAIKGPGWNGQLWAEVKAQTYAFLCSDAAEYSDLRTEWDALAAQGSHLAIAALSGAVGAQLGLAAGVVAPMVIWALRVAARLGKEAACRAFQPTSAEADTPTPTE